MMNRDGLLAKAESGFEGLKVRQKYVDSALKWLKIWLTDDAFSDYTAQIEHLMNAKNWDILLDHPGVGPGAFAVSDPAIRRGGPTARRGVDL